MNRHSSTDGQRSGESAVDKPASETIHRGDPLGRNAEAAPLDLSSEAAGVPAQRAVIEQAMAQQNVRLTGSPRAAVGPIGRTVLLIALLAVVALLVAWIVLAS